MSQTMGTAEQKPNVEAESGARANSMTEATGRLLRTDVRPLITEEEPCALEGGNISTFRRKFIWQVQSSRFVDKPIPRVDSSDEYVEKRVNEIGSYTQHAGYSLTIKTEDGYGLIVFVKRGMYENVPRGMEKAREQSENAFANLFKIYPPKADPKDRRHTQALRNGLASGSDKVLPCGRTVLFPSPIQFICVADNISNSCTGTKKDTPERPQEYPPLLAPRTQRS